MRLLSKAEPGRESGNFRSSSGPCRTDDHSAERIGHLKRMRTVFDARLRRRERTESVHRLTLTDARRCLLSVDLSSETLPAVSYELAGPSMPAAGGVIFFFVISTFRYSLEPNVHETAALS